MLKHNNVAKTTQLLQSLVGDSSFSQLAFINPHKTGYVIEKDVLRRNNER
jgi:hypothetical protein